MKPKDDDYATCWDTYATLRCYHPTETSEAVSQALQLVPDGVYVAGLPFKPEKPERVAKRHAWFLCSDARVASLDAEKHIAWIIDQIGEVGVSCLLSRGWSIDISCMWDSACGHGGPTLSPSLMGRLAVLQIPIVFDVYFRHAPILSGEESPKMKLWNQDPAQPIHTEEK